MLTVTGRAKSPSHSVGSWVSNYSHGSSQKWAKARPRCRYLKCSDISHLSDKSPKKVKTDNRIGSSRDYPRIQYRYSNRVARYRRVLGRPFHRRFRGCSHRRTANREVTARANRYDAAFAGRPSGDRRRHARGAACGDRHHAGAGTAPAASVRRARLCRAAPTARTNARLA
jgi:hypothetical protein